MKRIMRVFITDTKATPKDQLVRINQGPAWFDEADEVHISVTFSWDRQRAEELAEEWKSVARVRVGGPAYSVPGGEFIPGMYAKEGYTITSRGCPNRCWFCSVWKREGHKVRELPIRPGWNVLDDNLLACSDTHIRAVFAMLQKQKRKPEFTGGLEAARLKPWQAEALRALKTKQVFLAYDTPDDLEPLRAAGKMLLDAGFTTASHALRCYVLCGWPDGEGHPPADTFEEARHRMTEALNAKFTPMAMVYRGEDGRKGDGWAAFQRSWARPALIHTSYYK